MTGWKIRTESVKLSYLADKQVETIMIVNKFSNNYDNI